MLTCSGCWLGRGNRLPPTFPDPQALHTYPTDGTCQRVTPPTDVEACVRHVVVERMRSPTATVPHDCGDPVTTVAPESTPSSRVKIPRSAKS